ncbi:SurA N-terminal domain-containing protein [Legionella oakridgensis]|uniref:Periplasmic chaperone PpiD n=2 Tax=Legionella oakridgensis TaxID=29423 RepID=W0BCM1_9GAMM|nr:SurA N-terminal domain-containing protein [Legionella oakridgensis]AHE66446.1 parvulin-like peptidyl-prolyl isomerase [Legionella oakridgensis ATCC 33761 = DSM 21215]ETO93796.1 parvulin-like peptidyl-prolyl isomerase [Legionella oakridgensis RV-2-2007]KTD36881.1 peptidyl-prolyl cis-trans isomerase D [Legionella oakridgensis]STY19618.1 peptidyl-prolyl cis-trans isomerase D [Legionella longbeachae]
MLQKLNERIQGIVAWVIIILIAVTFTLFGVDYYMQSRQDTNVQVEVNGQPITKQAFELNYRRTRQMRDSAHMTAASENQLKKQILDEMIVNQVSTQAARRQGFNVSPEQANAAILSIPQFYEDGHFSADRYQQALSGALFTPESFQNEVRQGMLLNQQRFALIGTAFALPSEVKKFVKLYMQTRDYDYLMIPALPFKKEVNVSDEEISAYYQKHRKQFLTPEKIIISYVQLSMPDIKANIKLSDEQVKRYYEENQHNYLTPAEWQVAHILFTVPADASAVEQQQIKEKAEKTYNILKLKPELFEQKVEALSEDRISAMKQGILPWIVAGQSELDKSLVNFTEPGEILPPIQTRHGYELFKVLAYKPAKVKPYEEVKTDIEEQLSTELVQSEYAKALEQLTDLSYQTPDNLMPVAENLHLDIKTAGPFSRRGGNDLLTQNKSIIQAAFSHDVLEQGNNSEPIQINNDSVVVLRVDKRIPAKEQSLAEVKPYIVEQLINEKAELQAKNLGQMLMTAKKEPKLQEKLIEENQLKWQEVIQATRETDKVSSSINEMAFNLQRLGAETGRNLNNGSYVIVRLKKINDGELQRLDKEQIASITQQLEANYGMMDYDLYINGLVSNAKIVNH